MSGRSGAAPPVALPPALAGRYEAVEILGQGASAVVVRAEQRELARRVVVKLIRLAGAADPKVRERFLREAQVLSELHSPFLTPVLDFGMDEETAFLVFPDLGGATLGAVARQARDRGEPLSPAAVETLLFQCLAALDAVHQVSVIHRDLKPENLLVAGDGVLRVIDFGLVAAEATQALTATGSVMGTPGYMAPDQFGGGRPDPRDDLYSVGVSFYEVLTGENPFRAAGLEEIIERHLYLDPPRLETRIPGLPLRLAAVIHAMLAKSRAARPASAREALALLAEGAGPGPARSGGPAGLTEAATCDPDAGRPGPPRAAAGDPGAGSRKPASVAVVAIVLAAGLLGWPAFPPAAPEADPLPVPSVAPGEGPALGSEFRRSLAKALAPGGLDEALPPTEGTVDPLAWRVTVEGVGPVRRFYAWLDEGGRPETVAFDLREELLALARLLGSRGLADPFLPFLETRPSPEPLPFPGLPGRASDHGGRESPGTGWSATAFALIPQLVAHGAAIDQEAQAALARGQPIGMPLELARGLLLAESLMTTRKFDRPSWQLVPRLLGLGPEMRIGLATWLEGRNRTFEAWVYASARAARLPGEEGERAALAFSAWLGRLRPVGTLGMLRQRPRTLTGGRHPAAAASLVLAVLAYECASGIFSRDSTEPRQETFDAACQALAAPGDGRWARRRFEAALTLLGNILGKGWGGKASQAALGLVGSRLDAFSADQRTKLGAMFRRKVAAGDGLPPGLLRDLDQIMPPGPATASPLEEH